MSFLLGTLLLIMYSALILLPYTLIWIIFTSYGGMYIQDIHLFWYFIHTLLVQLLLCRLLIPEYTHLYTEHFYSLTRTCFSACYIPIFLSFWPLTFFYPLFHCSIYSFIGVLQGGSCLCAPPPGHPSILSSPGEALLRSSSQH